MKNVKIRSINLNEPLNQFEKLSIAKSFQEISNISVFDNKGEIKSVKFIDFNFKSRLYELYTPGKIKNKKLFSLNRNENQKRNSILNKNITNFSVNRNYKRNSKNLSIYDFSANSEISTKSLNIKKIKKKNNFEYFDFDKYFNKNFHSEIILKPSKKLKIKFLEKNVISSQSRYSLNVKNNNHFFDRKSSFSNKNYLESKILSTNITNLKETKNIDLNNNNKERKIDSEDYNYLKKRYIKSQENISKKNNINSKDCNYIKNSYLNSKKDFIKNKIYKEENFLYSNEKNNFDSKGNNINFKKFYPKNLYFNSNQNNLKNQFDLKRDNFTENRRTKDNNFKINNLISKVNFMESKLNSKDCNFAESKYTKSYLEKFRTSDESNLKNNKLNSNDYNEYNFINDSIGKKNNFDKRNFHLNPRNILEDKSLNSDYHFDIYKNKNMIFTNSNDKKIDQNFYENNYDEKTFSFNDKKDLLNEEEIKNKIDFEKNKLVKEINNKFQKIILTENYHKNHFKNINEKNPINKIFDQHLKNKTRIKEENFIKIEKKKDLKKENFLENNEAIENIEKNVKNNINYQINKNINNHKNCENHEKINNNQKKIKRIINEENKNLDKKSYIIEENIENIQRNKNNGNNFNKTVFESNKNLENKIIKLDFENKNYLNKEKGKKIDKSIIFTNSIKKNKEKQKEIKNFKNEIIVSNEIKNIINENLKNKKFCDQIKNKNENIVENNKIEKEIIFQKNSEKNIFKEITKNEKRKLNEKFDIIKIPKGLKLVKSEEKNFENIETQLEAKIIKNNFQKDEENKIDYKQNIINLEYEIDRKLEFTDDKIFDEYSGFIENKKFLEKKIKIME